jgi:hypothetical protein
VAPIDMEPATLRSYRHYRGGTYTLLMIARNSENRRQKLAVYVSHQRRHVWVRPWSMFTQPVCWPDGVLRPRFVLIEQESET